MQSSMAYSSATRSGGLEVGRVAPILHDSDVAAVRQLGQDAPHDVWARHEAVGVLVMLVGADAIEAALCRVKQLVERPVVVLADAAGVGQLPPRRRHPDGFVTLLEVHGQLPV